MKPGQLSEVFRSAGRQGGGADQALEGLLERCAGLARQAWPRLEVPPEELVAYAGKRARGELTAAEVEALHWADLMLACAAIRGDREALRALEGLVAEAARLAAQTHPRADLEGEVRQELWMRLLFPAAPGNEPRLLTYAGRGALRSWLGVSAARIALNLARAGGEAHPPQAPLEEQPEAVDLELQYLRVRHADQFAAAFRSAFDALEPRERTVLRWHLVDGVGLESIARYHRVHRSTVIRWIRQARRLVVERTCALLQQRVGVSQAELDSLMRAVRHGLDVSISQLLPASRADDPPGDPPAS